MRKPLSDDEAAARWRTRQAHQREYRQRPEVKAYHREYQREQRRLAQLARAAGLDREELMTADATVESPASQGQK